MFSLFLRAAASAAADGINNAPEPTPRQRKIEAIVGLVLLFLVIPLGLVWGLLGFWAFLSVVLAFVIGGGVLFIVDLWKPIDTLSEPTMFLLVLGVPAAALATILGIVSLF